MKENYFNSELRKKRIKRYAQIERFIVRKLRDRYLDMQVIGEENLPEHSAILAMHHSLGVDGWIIASKIQERRGKKVHYLTQKEGFFTNSFNRALATFLEEIPLSIKENETASYRQAVQDSEKWLRNTGDYLGVFVDGPFSRMVNLDRGIVPLKERPNYPIAALIAKKSEAPIIPVAEFCEEFYCRDLVFWWLGGGLRTIWRNIVYLERHKPLKYGLAFGKPIYPPNSSIKELAVKVRVEQERLQDILKKG